MPSATLLGALRSFAGVGANSTDHLEKWVSGIGGLTGILGVLLVSEAYLGLSGGAALVASMGASAVLLFAVPHGPLSQPWAVFGGHLVSAAIGIACTRLELDPILTAALAVALAISAMYYLRCIHPPGGATALSAVVGGRVGTRPGFSLRADTGVAERTRHPGGGHCVQPGFSLAPLSGGVVAQARATRHAG